MALERLGWRFGGRVGHTRASNKRPKRKACLRALSDDRQFTPRELGIWDVL